MKAVKFRSIDDIPANDMRQLTESSSLYESVEWMHYCELAAHGSLYYIGLADDSGAIVALTAMHLYESPSSFALRRPETLLDDQQYASVLYPCLTGVLDGVHSLLLLAPHLEECRQQIVHELVKSACEDGAARQAVTVSFPYFASQETAQAASLALNGSAKTSLITAGVATLTSNWPDFEGYVQSLEQGWHSNVTRERRRFSEAGYRIRVDHGISGLDEETAQLQAELLNKHGSGSTVNDILDGYQMLASTVPDHIVTFRCERDGALTGIAVWLRDADTLYLRGGGVSDDKTSFTYFNTMFYSPIEWGAANGIRRFGFGSAAYEAKRRRGCIFERRYGAIRWPAVHQDRITASAKRRQADLLRMIP
jgi:Peptidogalycan biosysnthesis/recognition